MKKFLFTLILLSVLIYSKAQGIGGGIIYNIPTSNVGFDFRYELPKRQFVLAPQASVFPGIGPITELNVGCSVHYIPTNFGKMLPYAILFGGYNAWINYKDSPDPNARFSNWSVEPGLGLTTRTCIRPYFEWRYSVKYGENNVRVGVIYTFNCGGHICQTYI